MDERFEKKAVEYSHEVFSRKRIVENLQITDQVVIDLECYANFNFKYRDKIVKEIVCLVISFKDLTPFPDAEKWVENLRQVFSLFFRKQLSVDEVSFFIPKIKKEFHYVYSDSRDFYGRAIKHRVEAVVHYSDGEVFKEVLKNFLHAEPRLKKLMDTFF